jgi:hypothetical protein
VGWIDAAYLELTSADLDEIATAIKNTRAGSGPFRPNQTMEKPELTSPAQRAF